MVKKFSLMIALAAILIFAGGNSQAEAEAVFIGNYSDGSEVYLLTHTITIDSRNPYRFSCEIRTNRDYLGYNFYPYNGSPYYRNSEGYSGYVFGGQSPVAANIYRYVVNNY